MFTNANTSMINADNARVSLGDLDNVPASKSPRGMENYAIAWLDRDFNLLQIKANGDKEIREERAEFLHKLNARHMAYIADTRKALAFTFSKRALYVLVSEMADHDKALADKAGREFCNTYNELERAIENVEARLSTKKPVSTPVDIYAIAKKEIVNRGSIRLEMMSEEKKIKVKYALKANAVVELVNHGWHMVLA
jgi:hypothetical protein